MWSFDPGGSRQSVALCLLHELTLMGFGEVILEHRIGQHTWWSFLFGHQGSSTALLSSSSQVVHPPGVMFCGKYAWKTEGRPPQIRNYARKNHL
jgi:hypothetical protein